jgi:hypothetical protein
VPRFGALSLLYKPLNTAWVQQNSNSLLGKKEEPRFWCVVRAWYRLFPPARFTKSCRKRNFKKKSFREFRESAIFVRRLMHPYYPLDPPMQRGALVCCLGGLALLESLLVVGGVGELYQRQSELL